MQVNNITTKYNLDTQNTLTLHSLKFNDKLRRMQTPSIKKQLTRALRTTVHTHLAIHIPFYLLVSNFPLLETRVAEDASTHQAVVRVAEVTKLLFALDAVLEIGCVQEEPWERGTKYNSLH